MILLFKQFVYCGKVLRLNPYKRSLPSDVTFVDVLRYNVLKMFCTLQHVFKYPCVLFMFVLLLIYHAK